ncbi:MAG: hypothetical protein Kow0029_23620 [Candidatus Rifleibacteriota bacterium]
MAKFRKLSGLILLLLIFAPLDCLFASNNSLEKLIESAVKNNPGLRSAYHNWKSSRAAIVGNTALADPVVNFRHNLEPVQTRTGEQNQVLTISQMLPYPGKQKAAIRIHRQMARNDELEYEIKLRNLIIDLKKSFAEIWFLKKAMAMASLNNQLLTSINKEVTSSGEPISLAPVLKAQSQMVQAANDLINYSELLAVEIANLKSLTGLREIDQAMFLELPVFDLPATNTELIKESLEQRLEILKSQNNEKIARTKVRLARFESRPDFVVGFSQALTGSRPDMDKVYLKGEGTDPTGIFVQMNLPVWQSKNRSKIREASEKELAAKAAIEAEKLNTEAGVIKRWFNAQNRKRVYEIYRKTILPQAEAAVKSAQSIYQNDVSKFSDYFETMANYYALKTAAYRAEADYFISVCELERFASTPIPVAKKEASK